MNQLIVLDLFSGGGGFALGASLAGFRVAGSVDIDPTLVSAHADNFPNTHLLVADLMETPSSDVLDQMDLDKEDICGIIGGPPCQGFSQIGRRDPKDPRNALVGRFFRIVEEIQPPFFVFENVPGILDSRYLTVLETVLSRTRKTYRILGPELLTATECDAPTVRTRVMIVGFRTAKRVDVILPRTEKPTLTVQDAIADLPRPDHKVQPGEEALGWAKYPSAGAGSISEYAVRMRGAPPEGLGSPRVRASWANGLVSGFHPTLHSNAVVKRFKAVAPGSRDRVSRFPRLRWDAPAPTLRAGTGPTRGSFQAVRPIHPSQDRVISVREAARIQGFPDWFRFHKTKWHSFRMIGNSVSPPMARAVLTQIRHTLTDLF